MNVICEFDVCRVRCAIPCSEDIVLVRREVTCPDALYVVKETAERECQTLWRSHATPRHASLLLCRVRQLQLGTLVVSVGDGYRAPVNTFVLAYTQ